MFPKAIRLIIIIIWAMIAPSVLADGWTNISPSPDSQIIYVSSSQGSDNNNGTSQNSPLRTLAAARNRVRPGYPDWILLRSDDVFNENMFLDNYVGRSSTEPIVISSYGVGNRPTIHGYIHGYCHSVTPGGNLDIINIKVDDGIVLLNAWHDILIEGNYISTIGEGGTGATVGFIMESFDPGNTYYRPNNVIFRRNIVADVSYDPINPNAYSQGLFISDIDNFIIEENIFDHNAVGQNTIYSHNMYITDSCVPGIVRNNITARSDGDGCVQLRCGGILENNLSIENAISYTIGSNTLHPTASTLVKNNVVVYNKDISPTLRRGTAYWFGGDNIYMKNNIAVHATNGHGGVGMNFDSCKNLILLNNLVYDWNIPEMPMANYSAIQFNDSSDNLFMSHNDIQDVTMGILISTNNINIAGCRFYANRYFSTNAQNQQFLQNQVLNLSYEQWQNYSKEIASSYGEINYINPNRTPETYMAMLGYNALQQTIDAFMQECRLQSKANWRPEFTAAAFNKYIRAGFNMQDGDINRDGSLNINDFMTFLNYFAAGDLKADADDDNILTINDFVGFQQSFINGNHN